MGLARAMLMAMPPVQVSFQKEEDYDAENKIGEYRAAFIIFQGFRQDMQKGGADKGSGGETDQAKKDLVQ